MNMKLIELKLIVNSTYWLKLIVQLIREPHREVPFGT